MVTAKERRISFSLICVRRVELGGLCALLGEFGERADSLREMEGGRKDAQRG